MFHFTLPLTIVIPIRFNQIIQELRQGVTRKFTEFSKGITFFASERQELRWPIYHRDLSCGTTAQKFVKTKFGPDMGPAISRCYIERLIYDEIFQNELGYHYVSHKLELDEVARHYDKFFPRANLRVKLRFLNNLVPISVDIITSDTFEKYTKTLDASGNYNDIVFCKKEESMKIYEKFQAFESEKEWI